MQIAVAGSGISGFSDACRAPGDSFRGHSNIVGVTFGDVRRVAAAGRPGPARRAPVLRRSRGCMHFIHVYAEKMSPKHHR
jgi:hypothetical protein